MLKKILAILLVLSMMLSFAACSDKKERSRDDDDDEEEIEELKEDAEKYEEQIDELEKKIAEFEELLLNSEGKDAEEILEELGKLQEELDKAEEKRDELVTEATEVETEVETEVVFDNIPEGLPSSADVAAAGFAGDFKILLSGNYVCDDFDSAEYTSLVEPTVIQTAIYRRNEALKADYGINVTVENVMKFGSVNGSGTGFQKISNAYAAGLTTYDAAAIGTYDIATLAYSGYLWDLNKIPYIDLTKDYWDQNAVDDLSVYGKTYFTSGDIGIINNKVTHAVLFNKDMRLTYKIEDPYELVRNNQWTLEKFSELVKQVGEDVDQNGIYDANDLYGLMTWKDPSLAILASAGQKIAGVNSYGELEYTLYNPVVVDLYDDYSDLVYDQAHVFNYQYDNVTGKQAFSNTWDTNRNTIFNSSRALFYFNTVATTENHRYSDLNFGILPYPKYDASQANYGHGVSPYHSQFVCIPVMSANPARSGLVLEYLAAKGAELLLPAYYEITLTGKSVRDVESAAMLDIIFSTRVYDLGAFYNVGDIKTQIGNMTVTRDTITNIDATYSSMALNQVEQLNQAFAALQY